MKNILWVLGVLSLFFFFFCTDGGKVYDIQAMNDEITIDAGGSIAIDVLQNDRASLLSDGTDVSSDLSLRNITQTPAHGTVTKDGNQIVYQHDGSNSTEDSFKYEAIIGAHYVEEIDVASVSIRIQQEGGEEPAENKIPTVNAGDDKTVEVGGTITITGIESDEDGNETIASRKWMEGATELATTVSFDYTPTVAGQHRLTFTVTDNAGATASDDMNVTVTEAAVNHAPVASDSSVDMPAECAIGTAAAFTLTGDDIDGDSLTFSKASDPTYGSVVIEDDGSGSFTLGNSEDQSKCMDGMPNNFTFKVYDGAVYSNEGNVTLSPPLS